MFMTLFYPHDLFWSPKRLRVHPSNLHSFFGRQATSWSHHTPCSRNHALGSGAMPNSETKISTMISEITKTDAPVTNIQLLTNEETGWWFQPTPLPLKNRGVRQLG